MMNYLCSGLGVSASYFAHWCTCTCIAYSPFIYHSCDISHAPFFIFFFSQCTVTCGQGLRYRVVLCIDHRGMHTGGCSPKTKPHIKEECIVPTPCYKPKGNEAEWFSYIFQSSSMLSSFGLLLVALFPPALSCEFAPLKACLSYSSLPANSLKWMPAPSSSLQAPGFPLLTCGTADQAI